MKIIKNVCWLVVLNVSLWAYSETIFGLKHDFAELIYSWAIDFDKFDTVCIHWIAMRIAIWLYVLWKMLWLEQSFMLYLFIRERNYKKMFIKQYGKCVMNAVVYFGAQMLIFAIIFLQYSGSAGNIAQCFLQKELWLVFLNQVTGVLNLCLLIYFLYCITKKVEISFLIVLGARLLMGFTAGSITKYTYVSLILNLALNGVLIIGVLYFASAKFYDRIQGEM